MPNAWRIGERVADVPEQMDAPEVDTSALHDALRHLSRFNGALGGRRALVRTVGSLLRRPGGEPGRLLDVATGYADFPVALARWCRRAGVPLEIVATDLHPATLGFAERHVQKATDRGTIRLQVADARHLPFGDGSFHVATCNTALHHFDDADAAAVLRELARVARVAVVVSDLRRGWTALLGARLLAATVWRRNALNRHDGPLSVLRSWTPAELAALAEAAGLRGAIVRAGPIRQVLVWRRGGAS